MDVLELDLRGVVGREACREREVDLCLFTSIISLYSWITAYIPVLSVCRADVSNIVLLNDQLSYHLFRSNNVVDVDVVNNTFLGGACDFPHRSHVKFSSLDLSRSQIFFFFLLGDAAVEKGRTMKPGSNPPP